MTMVDLKSLRATLPRFLALIGEDRWHKRVAQLRRDAMSSQAHAKIVVDYHWLEFALTEQMSVLSLPESADNPDESASRETPGDLLGALYFALTTIKVHSCLSERGRKTLEGRLRDCLRAESGFSPLYVEMELTRQLWEAGYHVRFADLEGIDQFDLLFENANVSGEVECKSMSADAGRKIHRKDFYRFMHTIERDLITRVEQGANDVILITLKDRLPSAVEKQEPLRSCIRRMWLEPSIGRIDADFFSVVREDFSDRFPTSTLTDAETFLHACHTAYGQSCHVFGPMTPGANALVVMRSEAEDDTSKPLLENLRKAATQFSGKRPGFIAVQFDDIIPADLLKVHLRRQAALLSYYLYFEKNASHVAATHFTTYGGMVVSPVGVTTPAFAVPNPKAPIVRASYAPFLEHIPDAEFARLLGEAPPTESISHIPIERK